MELESLRGRLKATERQGNARVADALEEAKREWKQLHSDNTERVLQMTVQSAGLKKSLQELCVRRVCCVVLGRTRGSYSPWRVFVWLLPTGNQTSQTKTEPR